MFKILDLKGYFQRHFELCKDCKTQAEAYERLEQELEDLQTKMEIPHKPRYTSYESFRISKTRYYKTNRELFK